MTPKSFRVLGLLAVLSLLLAACAGAQQTQAFPGLATDGELIYLAEGQHVRAVDVAGQVQRWQFPQQPSNAYGIFVSTPAVDGNLVVVASEGPAGSYSGAVFGLDRATGAQQWCLYFDNKAAGRLENQGCRLAAVPASRNLFGIGGAVDNRIIGGLTLAEGTVYFGMANGRVYAVDADTGQDLWFKESGRDVWSAPVVGEGAIYFGSLDHHIYALDPATGEELWSKDLGAAVAGTPTFDGERLYVGTFGSVLYALVAATGSEIWQRPAGNWVWDGPAVQGGTLYFTDVGGTIYAVDAETGQQQPWSQQPGGAMRARPAVTEEALFAGDRNGDLFRLDPANNGATVWDAPLEGNGQLLSTPVVLDDLVVVAPFGGNNRLVAYRTSGEFYWAFTPGN